MATIKLPQPLKYQQDIMDLLDEQDVKFVTFLKSRQSGGSFLNKMMVIKWGLENFRVRIGYVTPTLKLSKLFFKEICESLKNTGTIKDSNKSDLIIEFVSGSSVQFFSAESEDSIRGFQFEYLIIDEAAFQKQDLFDLVLRATVLIKGRKVLLCSTPNTANGFFHQHHQFGLDETYKAYRSYSITIYDNPFISQDELEVIKKSVPERVWRQEYMAEFIDGDGAVFTNFKNCINNKPQLTGKYYAAIDWAKENDYTVLTIMNEFKQVVAIKRWTGLDYTVQVDIISKLLNEWKPQIVISEENNIGTVVNELLKKQYKGKIKQITLDNSLKKEIIERLIVAFETNDITIIENNDLINELGWFSVEYNPKTQTVRYAAKSNLHDDTVISLAYAYYAVSQLGSKKINLSFV